MNLFENSRKTCRTELASCIENLGEVDIRRGILQEYSFSPLLFDVVLIPLVTILNETDLRLVARRNLNGRFKAECNK